MREVGETALRHGESGFRGFRIDEDGVAGVIVEGEKPMRDSRQGCAGFLVEDGSGVTLDPQDDEEGHGEKTSVGVMARQAGEDFQFPRELEVAGLFEYCEGFPANSSEAS